MLLFGFCVYINHQLVRMLTVFMGHVAVALASVSKNYILYVAIKCKILGKVSHKHRKGSRVQRFKPTCGATLAKLACYG